MLILTLGSMFLFVAIGIFAPKSEKIEELVVPKSTSNLVVKMEMKKPKEKSAGQPSQVKNTQAAPTQALENSTLPFTLALANKGYKKAIQDDKHLCNGLNVIDGKLVYKAVADALNENYTNISEIL